MTARDDAVETVSQWGAVSARPVVTADEVGKIVDRAARVDGDGRAVMHGDWTPTYDLYAATAEVWRIKAARVAADFNFTADNASFSKGDVLAQMLAMEAQYAAKEGKGLPRGSGNAGTIQVGSPSGGGVTLDAIAERVLP